MNKLKSNTGKMGLREKDRFDIRNEIINYGSDQIE